MIHFSLGIKNPFNRRDFISKTIYLRSFGYKTVEIEYTRDNSILDLWLRYTIRESHAGLSLSLSLLSFGINVIIEDRRHWNREANDWYNDEGC